MLYMQDRLVRVTSYRGEPRNRFARVVDVLDTQKHPLAYNTIHRNPIKRSRYLITFHDLDEDVFRSYYHEYVVFEPVGGLARFFWRIGQWLKDN